MSSAESLRQVNSLLDEVTGELPGAEPARVIRYLHRAAMDFVRDTGGIVYASGPEDFVAGQRVYPLSIPFDSRVEQVLRVSEGDKELSPYQYRVVRDPLGNVSIDFITPFGDCTGVKWSALATCVPTDSCKFFPKAWFDKWSHAIVSGALQYMLSDSTKPYANAANARYHSLRYSTAVSDANCERLAALSDDGQLSFIDPTRTFAGNF